MVLVTAFRQCACRWCCWQVSKGWDKIQKKLADREVSLQSVHELSRRYYEALQSPMEWLPDAMTDFDTLSPVSAQPEVIAQQQARLQVRAHE